MKILKAIPLLLIAAMLTSASGVRARTLHGVVLSADDNGNCKDKGLHKGNDKGRCGLSCLAACDAAAADGTAQCLLAYNNEINASAGDPDLVAVAESNKAICDGSVDSNHAACVAACSP